MKELSLKDIQNTQLRLLLAFDVICRDNGFCYSLGGGSLLGAIRHNGFIPWDDDIDVMMPRPDYESFLNYCDSHTTSFKLVSCLNCKEYYGLFVKLYDPQTIITDSLMRMPVELGVNIDVFPIDGLGNSQKEAVKTFRKTSFERELLNAFVWKRFFRSKTHSIFVEPVRLFFYIISRFINPNALVLKVNGSSISHSFNDSIYAGCICGSYREKEIMRKSTFEEYVEVEFEDHSFKAIKNYDEYLSRHYGDYMKMPNKEKQDTHHTYSAYLLS